MLVGSRRSSRIAVPPDGAHMQVQTFAVDARLGDLIHVTLRGPGAHLWLLTESEFRQFLDGWQFKSEYYEASPVFLRPPATNRWIVAAYGAPIRVEAVLPWELIQLGQQSRGRLPLNEPPTDTLRTYYTGEAIQRADEVEVRYPNLLGIPHRGIVHSIQDGPEGTLVTVIHKSKRGGGVSYVGFPDFEQGQLVTLRRRAVSREHADQVIARAEWAEGDPYSWNLANCEHFTDWCYTGEPGQSETLTAGKIVAGALVGAAALWAADRD